MDRRMRVMGIVAAALWLSALTLVVLGVGVFDLPILLVAAGLDAAGALALTLIVAKRWVGGGDGRR